MILNGLPLKRRSHAVPSTEHVSWRSPKSWRNSKGGPAPCRRRPTCGRLKTICVSNGGRSTRGSTIATRSFSLCLLASFVRVTWMKVASSAYRKKSGTSFAHSSPSQQQTKSVDVAITIYGIKNCETMKKARAWLDKHGVEYSFHDY